MSFSKKKLGLLLAGLFACSCCVSHGATSSSPVIIDYFYVPGCPDCITVREQVMPELETRFKGLYLLNKHDMGLKKSVAHLAAYQKKLGDFDNKPVSMIVDYMHVFNGVSAIKKGLYERIDESLADRELPDRKDPEPIISSKDDIGAILAQMKRFTAVAVAVAGITDGINPCAIATLVFFMSLLSVAGGKWQVARGRGLLLIGIPYCVASFVTYTAIGFGLLRALHLLDGFEDIRNVVEWGMIAVLGLFSVLSFRDAFRYKASGDPSDVSLQLPNGIKMKIHKIMRKGVRAKSLVMGGLVIGVLVTALEGVCTGQVYVPTLVVMINARESASTAWSYLLLYNFMFIVPLVVVFILTYFGLRTETLIEWSKKNVVVSKIILGVFFVAMALLIWIM